MKSKDVVYTEKLVYHKKYPELPTVTAVQVLEGFRVHIKFKDGLEKDIDLEPYLHGPVFEPIRNDPDFFRQVFVDPEGATLAWPNEVDIAPETLYYENEPVPWMVEYEERQKKKKVRQLRERKARKPLTTTPKVTKAKVTKKRTPKQPIRKKVVLAKSK